jgi:hypothetical protein
MTTDAGLPLASFEADIRPLFRERDRAAMLRSFDLWSYSDVRVHAEQIAARLQDGTMPCNGRSPSEDVAKFAGWITGGAKP